MPTLMAWPSGAGPRSNPYQVLLYRELASLGWNVEEFTPPRLLRRAPDLLHIHWPDLILLERRRVLRLLKSLAFLALFATVRAKRRPLIWTMHNPGLRQEQSSRWGLIYLSLVSRLCTGVIVLSHKHLAQTTRPAVVVPQPHYRGVYGPVRKPREAKRKVGLPESSEVLGFFGKVRPYKNLQGLQRAFGEMANDRALLLVAGEVDAACEDLVPVLQETRNVKLIDGFVADDDVGWLLGAMDLVVLPYRELSNSAVALLALSYDRPVLGPASAGSLTELQREVGDRWVRLYEGELSASHLEQALDSRPDPTGRPPLDQFAPHRVAVLTDRFLRGQIAEGKTGHWPGRR